MRQHMPGDHVSPTFNESGVFMSNGYVDHGPRRDWRDDRSAHRGSHRFTPEGGKDYNPTGVDTRYDRPMPGSILGRAKADGDGDVLSLIIEGRMRDEAEEL